MQLGLLEVAPKRLCCAGSNRKHQYFAHFPSVIYIP